MNLYNQNNFFKHTFCEFKEVLDFNFPTESFFKSKSGSYYFYTQEGVYRKSNHWGRVANCRWRIITTSDYKNQKTIIGFAKWQHFLPIRTNEKLFAIQVDFSSKTSKIVGQNNHLNATQFSLKEASLRVKEIKKLFQDNNWLTYVTHKNNFSLIKAVVHELATSSKSVKVIKMEALESK